MTDQINTDSNEPTPINMTDRLLKLPELCQTNLFLVSFETQFDMATNDGEDPQYPEVMSVELYGRNGKEYMSVTTAIPITGSVLYRAVLYDKVTRVSVTPLAKDGTPMHKPIIDREIKRVTAFSMGFHADEPTGDHSFLLFRFTLRLAKP